MTETSEQEGPDDAAPKKSKKGMVIGLVLALLFGAGGFYAVYSGLLLGHTTEGDAHAQEADPSNPLPEVAFVPIQPLLVNIGDDGENKFLRFQAQLEVKGSAEQEVVNFLPRIVDVLNGYLRAVDISELEQRAALVRLRAQMLRRIQVVTGEGRVRDLLIMEFVVN